MSDTDIPKYGIPGRIPRRSYTLSKEALEARRQNAQSSTGPKTEEGKKTASRNSWKHGLYAQSFILGKLGKPCKESCDKFPCDLVDNGTTGPGDNCLEKQFVAEAFDTIINSIENNKHGGFKDLAALEMAGAIQILRQMKEDILEDGVVIKTEKRDKDGHSLGFEYKTHPCLAHYTKLLGDLGFTPQEFLMTPKEIARSEKGKEEEEKESLQKTMANALDNLAKAVNK